VKGFLQGDGSLTLAEVPTLPPGPVEVVLTSAVEPLGTATAEALPQDESKSTVTPRAVESRRPDFIWPDESGPPPFDLPRLGPRRLVQVRPGGVRRPDPAFVELLNQ
jgi:hypothetical protein